MENNMTEEEMYESFLENKDHLQVNTYTYSKQARMFKQELSEERLAFECMLQDKKQKEEEHKKDVHFRKWQEGVIEDKELENEFSTHINT